MAMLTKFESKSSQAKAVALHRKRPWVLVSLHSSLIQLWDYRMGTLIDRFEGHEGPVRGLDFHPTQPLFVSCGDDYSVKVWSLQTRKCLFTLNGHLDYVRTVFFHSKLPWIISASDDQTIRIWNWQNRQEIACLTGHNHYVMCAQFHPEDDLVVSASLDQTVRVWDISGLRKRHSAPENSVAALTAQYDDPLGRHQLRGDFGRPATALGGPGTPPSDVFGNTDAVVKYVLEGHDRGVNWAAFHPTLPLIVSGGDDRILKLWRMSETKAWEVDTCRGHTSSVMCCLFHPHAEIIVSVSDDKSIRTWDLNKRTPVQVFKRDEKVWYVCSHPTANLFAAAHGGGSTVFKLERERPPAAVHQNSIVFVNREKQVRYYEVGAPESPGLMSLKKLGAPHQPFRSLSFNPAERSILVTSDNSSYELVSLPRDPSPTMEPTDTLRGTGEAAVFISRNRFAVLANNVIEIRDLANSITKSIKAPVPGIKDILFGGPGLLLILAASSVALYDIHQKKITAEMPITGIKYVSWSPDGNYIALLAKHSITIATKELETRASIRETIRIKSAAWDDSNVLIYSTLNHLKYSLLNGDHGILKTIANTVYVAKAKGSHIYCLTRDGTVDDIEIDPTEFRFKKALVNQEFSEVLRLIRNSQLVGQSIIAYLQQKGYPEVALQFVQDPQTKFDLAIECGNLSVALEQAKELGKSGAWDALGKAALAQGNHEIVELVYQKQHQFDKLAFLYLATGNVSNLQKMEQIADRRGDIASSFQTSIYLNSVANRIELLRSTGLSPLAYALAKSHGLSDIAQEIVDQEDVDESNIQVEVQSATEEGVIGVANDTYETNWPLKDTSMSFFEQAILDAENEPDEKAHEPIIPGGALELGANTLDVMDDDDGEEASGWGIEDDDLGIEDLKIEDDGVPEETPTQTELWIRNSPLAADHVAAGSFETAAQILNRQVGVTNFGPLKKRFLDIYRACRLYVPATEGLSPIPVYISRPGSLELPFVPGFDNLDSLLQEGYKSVKANKIELALSTFREILHNVVLMSVDNEKQAQNCKKLVEICRNYILAFSIEQKRRSLPASDVKRNLELAAYFTVPKLQPAHASLPVQVAMVGAFKSKNYASAVYFATEYLELVRSGPARQKAQAILSQASKQPLDEVEIDFNQAADFDICPATLTPIYPGSPFVSDPLTGAKYHPSYKGKLCKITGITTVGAPGSGLQVHV